MEEKKEDFAQEIRERIVNGFAINRIPQKKKDWFIAFAKDEFCDDRGMALVHLIDVYTGIIATGIEHLELAVEELQQRIDELKKEKEKPPEPEMVKMMDGTKRRKQNG